MILRPLVLLGALGALLAATPAHAQEIILKVAGGAAVPVGGAAEQRGTGPATMGTVEFRLGSHWGVRIDAEWASLDAPAAQETERGRFAHADVRVYGGSLNGVLRFPEGGGLAPYLLIGIGAYRLQAVDAHPSPYGTTGALQAGFGIDAAAWKRLNPFAEARAMVHVTDYASAEYTPTVYWPILVGVRVR